MNYSLISFITSISGILLATGISIFVYYKNRKNHIFKSKKKVNKLSKYITKVQSYNRALESEERWKNKNQVLNIFYTMEYLILDDLYKKIKDCKGFINWNQYNAIQKSLKYNKKNIKICNKNLKKLRNLIKTNELSINDFRIILFSDFIGINFDLYGQLVDVSKLNAYVDAIENNSADEHDIVGFNRPYNTYKFIPSEAWEWNFFKESSVDFDLNNYLGFNLFDFSYSQNTIKNTYITDDFKQFIKDVKKRKTKQ